MSIERVSSTYYADEISETGVRRVRAIRVEMEVTIDWHTFGRTLAARAGKNKSRKTTYANGDIVARIVKEL